MPEPDPKGQPEDDHELDWSSAVVSAEGRLEVDVTGTPGKRWKESFKAVADRLAREGRSQRWDRLSIKSKGKSTRVVIERLELDEGDYAQHVRQHLDAVIAQANAAVAPKKQAGDAERDPEAEADPRERAAHAATEAFRQFAEQ